MTGTKAYKSNVKAAIHEAALDLHEAGLLDKQTMRRFDEICLTAVRRFTADEIRALREREHVSQAVFALYLNVTKDSISQWERGDKRPAGPAAKLLSIVAERGLSAIA